MITPQEFKIMQDSVRCLIQVVFEYEKEFKDTFITPCTYYKEDEYSLKFAHISAYNMKVVLEFDDGDVVDVYRDLTEIIQWYYNLANKMLNK